MLLVSDVFYYCRGHTKYTADFVSFVLKERTIYCYDAKIILIYLMSQLNIEPCALDMKIFDVKIAMSLVDPDRGADDFGEVQRAVGHVAEYCVATECALQRCAWYQTQLERCASLARGLLHQHQLETLFTDLEMRVLPLLAAMEHRGISVDCNKLKSMEGILMKRMREIEMRCHKAAGRTFQIKSSLQVRNILYDELKLDTKSNIKIRETVSKGAKSTSETMLRSLIDVHPLPKLILEYRQLHKAHATFVSGIMSCVRNDVVKPTWLQKAQQAVSREERERTKRIVYASLYGAGVRTLGDILDVGYDQALAVSSSFHRTFPSLKSFGRDVVARCLQHQGRLHTSSGRTRHIPDICSGDSAARSHAQRQAVNFMVQGLAADICKLAMVSSDSRLRAAHVPCELVLQIHDELVWEVRADHLQTAAGIIKSTMEQCGRQFGMEVPLPVSLRCGDTWGDMEPLPLV
ncbi:DNA polymerase nu-like [Leptidea sinapis]|uniref:DNA polymerase nu-like n=1 Tax=Leptidea sinapis TaxID=189913 RepID=UPI0021C42D04|nr:DNA polymerase nu-like [Leptidea sinapis]